MSEQIARINLVLAVQDLVAAQMHWHREKALAWMTARNPNLGNSAPNEMIMRGRSHKVLAFIETAASENKIT